MNETEKQTVAPKVFTSSWAAFYLYYVAIAICWFGPRLNPEFAATIFLTPPVGLVLGLLLLAGVFYLKFGQYYEMGPGGVNKLYRWPARQESLAWSEIDKISLRAGLTQSLLGVGNIAIQPRRGEEMLWYGLESPKLIKTLLERGRDESASL